MINITQNLIANFLFLQIFKELNFKKFIAKKHRVVTEYHIHILEVF